MNSTSRVHDALSLTFSRTLRAQRAAMLEPHEEHRLGDQFQALEQHLLAPAAVGVLRREVAAGQGEGLDHRREGDAEQFVEFGDRSGADPLIALHGHGQGAQVVGFAEQPEAGEASQEFADRVLPRAGGDDRLSVPAAGQRDVEQRLRLQRLDEFVEVQADPRRVAEDHRGEDGDPLPLGGDRLRGFVQACAGGRVVDGRDVRRDDADGVVGFHRRGDDAIHQRFLEQPMAIVFDQRIAIAAAARQAVAGDRFEQIGQAFAVEQGLPHPARHRLAVRGERPARVRRAAASPRRPATSSPRGARTPRACGRTPAGRRCG